MYKITIFFFFLILIGIYLEIALSQTFFVHCIESDILGDICQNAKMHDMVGTIIVRK